MKVPANEKYYKIEIREKTAKIAVLIWKETTAYMSDQDFKDALVDFAGKVSAHRTPFLLIDTMNWKYRFKDVQATMAWRKQNIVPEYKKAGVIKEAFLIPEGAPKMKADYGTLETDSFNTEKEIERWFFS